MTKMEELKAKALDLSKAKDFAGAEKVTREYIEYVIFEMTTSSDQFFAHLAMKITRDIDFKLPAPAAVRMVDGYFHMSVNPLLLFNEEYTDENIKAIIIHESYHIIFLHLERALKLKNKYLHEYVNIAMDCAINQFINNLPDGTVTLEMVEKLCNKRLDRQAEYEYYLNELVNSKSYEKSKQAMESLRQLAKALKEALDDFSNGGSGKSNSGESLDDILKKIKEENEKAKKEGRPAPFVFCDHDDWKESSKNDIDNLESATKDLLEEVIRSCKDRGKIPGHIINQLDKMNKKSEITWQQELKYLTGNVKVPFRKTFIRPNRRLPNRTDIPGRLMDRTLKIAVAIDTSGSVSDSDLKFIFNEIFSIIKAVKFELTIIECDAQINHVYKAKDAKHVTTKVHGRGGTAFTPVFKYIRETRSLKDIDLLVYFTDGYGEYEIPLQYRPKGYNVMWVITEDKKHLSVKNPFTKRIRTLHTDNR